MIAELLGLVDALSKANDIRALLAQERLRTMIEFLETIGEIHIKTAIEELETAQKSSRPEEECNRAIGQLRVAANALAASLQRRPLLQRLRGSDKRKMRIHLQITGCYLAITGIYAIQRNMEPAKEFAARALQSFQSYASLRRRELSKLFFGEFTYNGGTDQAPLVCFVDNDDLRKLMRRYGVHHSVVFEDTLHELAANIVEAERRKLFGWLEPRGIRS